MITFHLPDLGEGLQEAEIVAWHVGEGDHVVVDQPLLSVETDKAVVEIPAPVSGRVVALHAAIGDLVPTDAALVDLESTDAGEDTGTVVGVLPVPESDEVASIAGAPHQRVAVHANATPAVRALATRLAVDLDTVTGSGPRGTITRADVEHAAAQTSIAPMRGVRRAMSRNMALAHAQVVPATLTDVADIDDWSADDDVTLRLIRAISVACGSEPALNAAYLGLEQGRRLNEQVDLGIAMDTEQGLFVPVLRDTGRRSMDALHSALARMKADVRARSVPRAELRGATITLSNFGMLGGLHAALVVVPPQVAIIGAGRVHERVVPVQDSTRKGEVAVRRALPLSITFDHRAVMGSEVARFMAAMRADLSAPA
jgi:pyruvate dehydrogenase E2 component (dihydrolipoamide acetyltransferase)